MRVTNADDIARVVRAERTRRPMSQAELAAAANVSRRWIAALEAGKPRAELALVLAVLDVLGVPLHADTPDETKASSSPVTTHAEVDLDEHVARLGRPH